MPPRAPDEVGNRDPYSDGSHGFGEPSRLVRAREWLLLTGDRLVVSGVFLLGVAVVVVGSVASGFVPLRVREPMVFILFALISGNFVLVTIVVSLNQFVLTRHLESPDEIRRRLDEMFGFRREVSEAAQQTVLPITPSGFLTVIFYTLARQARDIEREVPEIDDDQTRAELHHLARELQAHTAQVVDLLEDAPRGVQQALFATLSASYPSYIYLAFHLESEHAASLTEAATSQLSGVVRSLEQVDVARRFFKTGFIQSELASLSRLLLYIGLGVQLVTVVMMLSFTTPVGVGPSRPVLLVAIPGIVIVGFAPLVILASFIVRLSTVAQRTAAMYPFTEEPREVQPVLERHDQVEVARSAADDGREKEG